MAIPTLMKVLTTCYGGKMRSHTMFTTILKKKLPPSLTTTQGQELGERLVVRCIFPPSLAEILEEWRLMQSESRRPEKAALPEWTKQSLCPSVRRQIEDVKARIRRRDGDPGQRHACQHSPRLLHSVQRQGCPQSARPGPERAARQSGDILHSYAGRPQAMNFPVIPEGRKATAL